MSNAYDLANLSNLWGFSKRNSSYSGYCLKVRRLSDSSELDIGFSAGYFDVAAYETFIAATSGVVVKAYDQKGGKDLVQADTSKQPALVKHEGIWKIKFAGGKYLSIESSLGTFGTQVGVSIVWQGPTDLAGLTTFRGDVDLGGDLQFITGQWTSFGAPYSRHGGSDLTSWANWDSRKARHDFFKYNNGAATAYSFGVKASATLSPRDNPTFDRLRWGTAYTGFNGNHYGLELAIYNSNPDPVLLSENVTAEFSSLFQYGDVAFAIGDSNSATGYSGGPGTLWTRFAFLRRGFDDWFCFGEGASTLLDWTSRVPEFSFFFDNFTITGRSILVIALGTSDIYGGQTGAQAFARLENLIDAAIDAGFAPGNIYVQEVLPRNASAPFATERTAYNALLNADDSGNFKVIKTTENPTLESFSDTDYFADGTHLTATGQSEFGVQVTTAIDQKVYTDPGESFVKSGITYVYDDTEKTGTYKGAGFNTDPGVENVLEETEYSILGVSKTGTFNPAAYYPTDRAFYNTILRVIGAPTLTDDEFDALTISGKAFSEEIYLGLLAVLDARETVSSERDKLTYYFKARGVDVAQTSAGKSNILIGASLED